MFTGKNKPQFISHIDSPIPNRNATGHIILSDPEFGTKEYDTLTCKHCQFTWALVKGSGIERGFCMKCMGPTCGKSQCEECVPFLKRLDLMEKNNHRLGLI